MVQHDTSVQNDGYGQGGAERGSDSQGRIEGDGGDVAQRDTYQAGDCCGDCDFADYGDYHFDAVADRATAEGGYIDDDVQANRNGNSDSNAGHVDAKASTDIYAGDIAHRCPDCASVLQDLQDWQGVR